MAEQFIESCNRPESTETVRCIIVDETGRILLLQKSKDSKAPSLFEFPGGKIDKEVLDQPSSRDQQMKSVLKEVYEESGIELKQQPSKVNEFCYEFYVDGKINTRIVHLYITQIDSEEFDVSINKLPEDKHSSFLWVTPEEIDYMKANEMLSGNSQHFPFLAI